VGNGPWVSATPLFRPTERKNQAVLGVAAHFPFPPRFPPRGPPPPLRVPEKPAGPAPPPGPPLPLALLQVFKTAPKNKPPPLKKKIPPPPAYE